MVPSASAVAFWWLFTPPSFRFIWGPLFTLAAIPAGWALWRLSIAARRRGAAGSRWQWVAAAGVAVPVIAVTVFSAVARFDIRAHHRGAHLVPRRSGAVRGGARHDCPWSSETLLPSGLTILAPTESDQCWGNYPLCSPMFPSTLSPRGPEIGDGFRP